MIRIAIVEDDKHYISDLKKYIARYEKESDKKILVTVFEDGEDIVEDYSANYDIILMDIEMQFMNGMTAATKIREKDKEVVLIFVTNMPQYVMEGYKVDALDYVLKPLSYFALSQRINRAISRMDNRRIEFITISTTHGGIYKVAIDRIYLIEMQNHHAIFHTIDGTYEMRESLTTLEKKLNSGFFYRCHKSYMVNLAYVDSIQGKDVYIRDQIIQVSRNKKRDFIDALNNFLSEVSK